MEIKNTSNRKGYKSLPRPSPKIQDLNRDVSKEVHKTTYNNKSNFHKKFTSPKNALEQKYRKMIEMILDHPNEKIWILSVSISHLPIFECGTRPELEEFVLKPIIQKAAIKRDFDPDSILDLINSRLKWEVH